MSTVPSSVKAPRFPQVNLLPPEVGQRRARSRKRAFAGFLLFVFVLALGGLGYLINGQAQAVRQELAAAEDRNAELQAEAARYAEVPVIKAVLRNAASALAYAAASEINHAEFRVAFERVIDSAGVELHNLGVNKVNLSSNPSLDAGPFATADIGSVTFSGTSVTVVDVAALIDALEELPGVEHVRMSVATRTVESTGGETGGAVGAVVYLYSGSARVTFDALTLRFAPEGFVVELGPDESPETDESAEPGDETPEGDGDA